jgi:hypothetical protein
MSFEECEKASVAGDVALDLDHIQFYSYDPAGSAGRVAFAEWNGKFEAPYSRDIRSLVILPING